MKPQDYRKFINDARADFPVYKLAKAARVPTTTLNGWLNGTSDSIGSEALASVCAVLGLVLVADPRHARDDSKDPMPGRPKVKL